MLNRPILLTTAKPIMNHLSRAVITTSLGSSFVSYALVVVLTIHFRYGDVAFFVLDTRLYRTGAVAQEGDKTSMLGERQLSALYEWLDRVRFSSATLIVILLTSSYL